MNIEAEWLGVVGLTCNLRTQAIEVENLEHMVRPCLKKKMLESTYFFFIWSHWRASKIARNWQAEILDRREM